MFLGAPLGEATRANTSSFKRIGDDPDAVSALEHIGEWRGDAPTSPSSVSIDGSRASPCYVCCRTDDSWRLADAMHAGAGRRVPLRRATSTCPFWRLDVNRTQVKGRVNQIKGKIKKVAGSIAGNKALEQRGRSQEVFGEAQASFEDLKDDLKDLKNGAPHPKSGPRRVIYVGGPVECPSCHGRAYRVQRRPVDRLLSLIALRRRYRCGSMGCGWEGNLSPSAGSLPSRTDPVM